MGFIFSFRPRFVNPIRAGLGLPEMTATPDRFEPALGRIKRQTIRAERADGKRPAVGDELHLFTGMRTPQCERLAPRRWAFVTDVRDIAITLATAHDASDHVGDTVKFTPGVKLIAPIHLHAFSQDDGFRDWQDMRDFWHKEHRGVSEFAGFITFWGTK